MTSESVSARPGWRQYIKIHPACDVLPLLPPDQLRELAEDIKARGLLTAICLSTSGVLLDGRNRLDALELNGESIIDPATGTFALDFRVNHVYINRKPRDEAALVHGIIARNILRRHLSEQERVDLALAILKTLDVPRSSGVPSPVEQRPLGAGAGRGSLQGSTKSVVGTVATMAGVDRKTARKHLAARGVVPKRKPKLPAAIRNLRVITTPLPAEPRTIAVSTTLDAPPPRTIHAPVTTTLTAPIGVPGTSESRETGYAKLRAIVVAETRPAAQRRLVEIVNAAKRMTKKHPDEMPQLRALWRLLAEATEDGSLRASLTHRL